jgi:hypothetical protein
MRASSAKREMTRIDLRGRNSRVAASCSHAICHLIRLPEHFQTRREPKRDKTKLKEYRTALALLNGPIARSGGDPRQEAFHLALQFRGGSFHRLRLC